MPNKKNLTRKDLEQKVDKIYNSLTSLLKSNVSVRANKYGDVKIKDFDTYRAIADRLSGYSKIYNTMYIDLMSQVANRYSRISEYDLMEQAPEISSALDIYADESTVTDENGNILAVESENETVKEILENLFYDVLNIDMHMWSTLRNTCKYGDYMWVLNIDPIYGIKGFSAIDPALVERVEGTDEDPNTIFFKLNSSFGFGSSIFSKQKIKEAMLKNDESVLQNWQVAHFRLVSDLGYNPYGRSVLEGARKVWKQLILMEDSMLVYRITRAPERRVFHIDVGSLKPNEIKEYIDSIKNELKKSKIIDQRGNIDLKYNVMASDEDYFIPVRGAKTSSSIDTLPGAQNLSEISDIEYIFKKVMMALKIPLGFMSNETYVNGRSTLSMQDYRFSRTISRIQQNIIAELEKIAVVHLFILGYRDDDLLDFKLSLTNPSSLAEEMKLNVFKARMEAAQFAIESKLFDRKKAMGEILLLSEEEIEDIDNGIIRDANLLNSINPENMNTGLGGFSNFGTGGATGTMGGGITGDQMLSNPDSMPDYIPQTQGQNIPTSPATGTPLNSQQTMIPNLQTSGVNNRGKLINEIKTLNDIEKINQLLINLKLG